MDTILDLILDATDPCGDNRPGFPHCFGDGQAKALTQALLDHDAGMTLYRVDNGRVLDGIGSRQQRQMDTAFDVFGQLLPVAERGLQYGPGLRVISNANDLGPDEHEVCRLSCSLRQTSETLDNAYRVLQGIPAGDLDD